MLSSVPRSATPEMDQRASPTSLRTFRSSSVSLKYTRSFEEKVPNGITSSPQDDLMMKKPKEKSTTPENSEVKKMSEALARSGARIKLLEKELRWAKESENNMLESLISQTKQLEGTKIELEEAKLEIRTLQEAMRDKESASSDRSGRNLEKNLDKSHWIDPARVQDEMARLKIELKLALEAEEKSKKAMDDLAEALKEIAGEANHAKEKLLVAETELSNKRAEADSTKSALEITEEKLKLALEEAQRVKMESEEAAAAWDTKQEGFRECMSSFEEEITRGKQDIKKLNEAQRASKEEISKLRDIMKHALNEATIVKEALEIARNENSVLKDMMEEKEKALQHLKHKHEIPPITQDSMEELEKSVITTPKTETTKVSGSIGNGTLTKSEPAATEMKERDTVMEFALAKVEEDSPLQVSEVENHGLNHRGKSNHVKSDSLRFPLFDGADHSGHAKGRRYGSFSAVPVREAQLHSMDDVSSMYTGHLGHRVGVHSGLLQIESDSPTTQRKKKTMFRRFADIVRRRGTFK